MSKKTLKSDLVQWFHGALFSPVTSTLTAAIKKGYLLTFPGFTENLLTKHLPPSVATAFGHLNREKQNLQTTKPVNYDKLLTQVRSKLRLLKRNMPAHATWDDIVKKEITNDFSPLSDSPNQKTN